MCEKQQKQRNGGGFAEDSAAEARGGFAGGCGRFGCGGSRRLRRIRLRRLAEVAEVAEDGLRKIRYDYDCNCFLYFV